MKLTLESLKLKLTKHNGVHFHLAKNERMSYQKAHTPHKVLERGTIVLILTISFHRAHKTGCCEKNRHLFSLEKAPSGSEQPAAGSSSTPQHLSLCQLAS